MRLIESGILKKDKLLKKYLSELHSNEIILLAYYIACINIESAFHESVKPNSYTQFNGAVLTDTFQLYEQERDLIADLLPDNSQKRTKQKKRDIRVIVGNPPYSAGQESAHDDAKNLTYPNLDEKIKNTYVKNSTAVNRSDLYDSYIRSFRWATDRLGEEGVIGFVTNAGWVDGNASDGLRKVLRDEFYKIYIFHLKGNARTAGELRKKEAGNVFGHGSRSPIAITILVKKNSSKKNKQGNIFFYEIGDYLKKDEKLKIIKQFNNIYNIEKLSKFSKIQPDENNDWINKSNPEFKKYYSLGSKQKNANVFFKKYSLGIGTNKDSWVYNFSEKNLLSNMKNFIEFYNHELNKISSQKKNEVSQDKTKIIWTRKMLQLINNKKKIIFSKNKLVNTTYRPFVDKFAYFDNDIIENNYGIPSIFPNKNSKNYLIALSGLGARNGFSVLAINKIPDLNLLEGGTQCFPLYLLIFS